jgi:hypothetical protein
MKRVPVLISASIMLVASLALGTTTASAEEKKPNIIFITGDDIGWSNIGVYNQGIMAGRTFRAVGSTFLTTETAFGAKLSTRRVGEERIVGLPDP